MKQSSDHPRCFEKAFSVLSPFHRDVLAAVLGGDDENSDDSIATRYGTTLRAVRTARILARLRLREALASAR